MSNFTTLAEGICDKPGQIFSYIDNLERLKIIDVPAMVRIYEDEAYKDIENCQDIRYLMKSDLPEGSSWEIIRKKFEVTYYGKQFIDICVRDY